MFPHTSLASKYYLVVGFAGIWLAATLYVDRVDYKAAARSWLRISQLKFLLATADCRLPLTLKFICAFEFSQLAPARR